MEKIRVNAWWLKIYKEALGEMSFIEIANEFRGENEARWNIFGKFNQ